MLKYDAKIIRKWTHRIEEKVIDAHLLYEKNGTHVVRFRTERCTFIGKESMDAKALQREVLAHQTVVTSVPTLHTARIVRMFDPHVDDEGWICYSDDHLLPVKWTERKARAAIDVMVALHEASSAFSSSAWASADSRSHTPTYREIVEGIQDYPQVEQILQLSGLGTRAKQCIERIHHEILRRKSDAIRGGVGQQRVICHGDMHWGNLLSRGRNAALYVIDWEFLHADSPYFDLFQMLDATSPYVRLKTPIRRNDALSYYYHSAAENRLSFGLESKSAFLRGYFAYAAAHLMWILLRIASDQTAGRFSPTQLRRQRAETLWRLTSLAYTLWTFDTKR